MVYMVTFTINIPPMLVYIPYMDPMGNVSLYRIFWVFVFTTSGWCFEICVFFENRMLKAQCAMSRRGGYRDGYWAIPLSKTPSVWPQIHMGMGQYL